jgi:hypothetical protein
MSSHSNSFTAYRAVIVNDKSSPNDNIIKGVQRLVNTQIDLLRYVCLISFLLFLPRLRTFLFSSSPTQSTVPNTSAHLIPEVQLHLPIPPFILRNRLHHAQQHKVDQAFFSSAIFTIISFFLYPQRGAMPSFVLYCQVRFG